MGAVFRQGSIRMTSPARTAVDQPTTGIDELPAATVIEANYSGREAECPFCTLPSARINLDSALAIAIDDGYPVSKGHSLVIPRRHVVDYWGLTEQERNACHKLLVQLRDLI